MEYSAEEKLAADLAKEGLIMLNQAYHAMRQLGWHQSTERDMKISYLGVNAALHGAPTTMDALQAILNAPTCPSLSRLPAWNGYPHDEKPTHDQEAL